MLNSTLHIFSFIELVFYGKEQPKMLDPFSWSSDSQPFSNKEPIFSAMTSIQRSRQDFNVGSRKLWRWGRGGGSGMLYLRAKGGPLYGFWYHIPARVWGSNGERTRTLKFSLKASKPFSCQIRSKPIAFVNSKCPWSHHWRFNS